MGKIRIKTIGVEDEEKKQKQQAKARAEAKRIEAAKKAAEEKVEEPKQAGEKEAVKEEPKKETAPETKPEEKKKKVSKKEKFAKQKHSQQYLSVSANIDKAKMYALTEALALLPKMQRAKFDETVELHINTVETGVSGNFVLPHGTGKTMKVEIADQTADSKHVEELVKSITAGKIDFDILIATPDAMPHLAKVARVLGPKGLMPNPKNGTVNPKPQEVAKKFEGGQMNFKTEAKFPLLHLAVGKVSFGEKKLAENIKTAVDAIKVKNVKSIVLKSTMSPAIKLNTASL